LDKLGRRYKRGQLRNGYKRDGRKWSILQKSGQVGLKERGMRR
jgi:hypothetical protein